MVEKKEAMMKKSNVKYVRKQVSVVLAVSFAVIALFVLGLVIGYGVIGEGDNPFGILSVEKLQDLVNKFTGGRIQ